MKVTHMPENGTNFIPFEVMGKNIDFNDGELMFNVSKKERDYEVIVDICRDYTGGLVMGATGGERYVAQLIIPEREYEEVEKKIQITIPIWKRKKTLRIWKPQEEALEPRRLLYGSQCLLIWSDVN